MKNEINTIWLDLNEELNHFILGKIKDEQVSKDIHQEVFLKIQTKIHQLQHTSKLTSWVYQITRNTIIDYFRKQGKSTVAIDEIDLAEEQSGDFDYAKLTNCINQKIGNYQHSIKKQLY